jgi:hypothetical protein
MRKTKRRQKLSGWVGAAAGLMILATVSFSLWWRADPGVARETGVMELTQALFILLSLVLCLWGGWGCRRRQGRYPFGFLSLFFLTLLLREVDVEKLQVPEWLVLWTSGWGRNLLLAAAWAGYFVAALKKLSLTWSFFKDFVFSLPGFFCVAGGVFYLLGLPFDKGLFDLTVSRKLFYEEIFEFHGTLNFLFCALSAVLASVKDSPPPCLSVRFFPAAPC